MIQDRIKCPHQSRLSAHIWAEILRDRAKLYITAHRITLSGYRGWCLDDSQDADETRESGQNVI